MLNKIKFSINDIEKIIKGVKMMSDSALLRLSQKEISIEEAYSEMFPKKKKKTKGRAHFVILRFKIHDSKGVSRFLNILFFLPMPLVFVKMFIRLGMKHANIEDMPLSKEEIMELLKYKVKVEVNSSEKDHILIKTI